MAGMREELEIAWKTAFSIQSKPEEAQIIDHIGKIKKDEWIYDFFKDNSGRYWFECLIETEKGIVTLHEAVHGRRPRNAKNKAKR